MQLWEIILPLQDNSGRDVQAAHSDFAGWLIDTFGGFTRARGEGAWQDAEGKLYLDSSYACRIGYGGFRSTPEDVLISKARELFPDQEAFFLARIGHAWIKPARP